MQVVQSQMSSLRDYGLEFTGLRMWPVPKFLNYLIVKFH
jgi:hypothetical protein